MPSLKIISLKMVFKYKRKRYNIKILYRCIINYFFVKPNSTVGNVLNTNMNTQSLIFRPVV